MGKERPELDL